MLGKNRSSIYLHMRICLSAKCLKACTYLKYGAEKPDTYVVNWAKCVFFILQSLRPATSSLQSLCVQLPQVYSLSVSSYLQSAVSVSSCLSCCAGPVTAHGGFWAATGWWWLSVAGNIQTVNINIVGIETLQSLQLFQS